MMKLLTALALAPALIAASPAHAQFFERQTPESAEQVRLSFAPVVKEAAPAVVNVYAQRIIRTSGRPSLFDDPIFREFFGGSPFGMPQERVQNSLGSGVVVRDDGIIVTNNHVVGGADEFRVVLSDRREYDAELVLADERTDLAVLRIDTEGEKLPTLDFAESADLEVGDLVLAIGNPFGVGQTVTNGIVSALGRSDVGVSDYSFFIQTDAAINPGNSGGALVDLDGKLAGINTAIFSRSGGSNGIGFAIPAELVARVVESALTDGAIVRPWLGAKADRVTADIAGSIDLARPTGAIVTDVYPNGPADDAGLEVGDVILAMDGVEVNDEQAIRFRLATRRVGDKVALRVWRDGSERTATLEAEAPVEKPARDQRRIDGRNPLAGAEVVNLSPAFNESVGLDMFASGVAVYQVEPGTPAAYYFRPGDIIVEVEGEEVHDTRSLELVLTELEGERTWSVVVERGGRRVAATLRF
jgi:Do/DeqQ family serine protease